MIEITPEMIEAALISQGHTENQEHYENDDIHGSSTGIEWPIAPQSASRCR